LLIWRCDNQHNDTKLNYIQHNETEYKDTQHNALVCVAQHKRHSAKKTLSIITPISIECRYVEPCILITVILSVIKLNVVMLSVVMLIVIKLSVLMMNFSVQSFMEILILT
jgi:hypothetical protein